MIGIAFLYIQSVAATKGGQPQPDAKDFALLVFGAVLGLLLALFVQPLLEDHARGVLIRLVGKFTLRTRSSLAGCWNSVWAIDGAALDTAAEMRNIVLHQVGTRVAGTFLWHGRTYRLLGNRLTPNFVSGTYEDTVEGYTLHGAFQLEVYPKEQFMVGRWMGFNRHNRIVEGAWEWKRIDCAANSQTVKVRPPSYPFEENVST
jgi:hypothetical protein